MAIAAPVRRSVAQARQLAAELTEAWAVAWRRSLQLRVVISTLALSTAVVVVLGFVLQTQIAQRVMQGKEADALARTESGAVLLEQVWGYRHAADTRLVNVHVQRLRSKIERDPEHPEIVVTVRGIGYKAGEPVRA